MQYVYRFHRKVFSINGITRLPCNNNRRSECSCEKIKCHFTVICGRRNMTQDRKRLILLEFFTNSSPHPPSYTPTPIDYPASSPAVSNGSESLIM